MKQSVKLNIALFITMILFLAGFAAYSKSKKEPGEALVVFLNGETFIENSKGKSPLNIGSTLAMDDIIETKKGNVQLQIGDVFICHISSFTRVSMKKILSSAEGAEIELEVEYGQVYSSLLKQSGSSMVISSPTITAGVRGTECLVAVESDENSQGEDADVPTGVYVKEGLVEVTGEKKKDKVMVKANEQCQRKGNDLVKGVLENYIEQKMKILETLKVQKESNEKMMDEQKKKNQEILDKIMK